MAITSLKSVFVQIMHHLPDKFVIPHVFIGAVQGKQTAFPVTRVVIVLEVGKNILRSSCVVVMVVHPRKAEAVEHSPEPLSESISDSRVKGGIFASSAKRHHHLKNRALSCIEFLGNNDLWNSFLIAELISEIDTITRSRLVMGMLVLILEGFLMQI